MPGRATFRMFQDEDGEFRWSLVGANGESIALSGEGYERKEDCANAVRLVQTYAPEADVVDETVPAGRAADTDTDPVGERRVF